MIGVVSYTEIVFAHSIFRTRFLTHSCMYFRLFFLLLCTLQRFCREHFLGWLDPRWRTLFGMAKNVQKLFPPKPTCKMQKISFFQIFYPSTTLNFFIFPIPIFNSNLISLFQNLSPQHSFSKQNNKLFHLKSLFQNNSQNISSQHGFLKQTYQQILCVFFYFYNSISLLDP